MDSDDEVEGPSPSISANKEIRQSSEPNNDDMIDLTDETSGVSPPSLPPITIMGLHPSNARVILIGRASVGFASLHAIEKDTVVELGLMNVSDVHRIVVVVRK